MQETIKTWLQWAKTQVDTLDAELIAMHVFAPRRADRSWLVAHHDDDLGTNYVKEANSLLAQRHDGMPLAYVLGEKEFYGRKFMVGKGVLIPRPETESLINLIKQLDLPKQPKFLEIGTGSGCIAITLALEYAQSYVLASDISPKALIVAKRNNTYHEGRVDLVESDLLKNLTLDLRERFNVVVANLPYVNKDWEWVDEENLRYEPVRALYARGSNGLSIYRRFFKELQYRQRIEEIWADYVVVEADPCQHEELKKIAERAGWFYLKTDGYGLLFESDWRYSWDWRQKRYVHKSNREITEELVAGKIRAMMGEDFDFNPMSNEDTEIE